MSVSDSTPLRANRSFVIREGRFTGAQKKALNELWSQFGITVKNNVVIDFKQHFPRQQELILDIGFGNGDSVISLAQQRTDLNFIGVEVYRPGIGAVLRRIAGLKLDNVRIIHADVADLLASNIAAHTLLGVMVWFPDPWPKKRHHKRRLVQKNFLKRTAQVLKPHGILHLASDWQPYVEFIQEQANTIRQLIPLHQKEHPLQLQRPSTRFEQKGLRKGHVVSDLYYQAVI